MMGDDDGHIMNIVWGYTGVSIVVGVARIAGCLNGRFWGYHHVWKPSYNQLPSGKHTESYRASPFSSWIYPLNMVIFHSYVNVYQRV